MSDKPKNTIKNAVLRVIVNQIWHFIRTWLVAKPVYVSAPDEVGNIVPVRDPETGQKKINWIATVAGRVIQLLGVVGWLPVVLWGQPLDWWVELLSKIGNLF